MEKLKYTRLRKRNKKTLRWEIIFIPIPIEYSIVFIGGCGFDGKKNTGFHVSVNKKILIDD